MGKSCRPITADPLRSLTGPCAAIPETTRGFYAAAQAQRGAGRAGFEEAPGIAVCRGGGPSLMHAADTLSFWEECGGALASAPAA